MIFRLPSLSELFAKRNDPLPDRSQFARFILQFVEPCKCFPLREMGVQQLHDLVVVRSYGSELSVKLRQLGYVFHRSAIGFYHPKHVAENPRFDESRFRQQPRLFVHRQKSGVFLCRKIDRIPVFGRVDFGWPTAFSLRDNLFFSIHRNFSVVSVSIPSWCSRLSKSADFGGAPLQASCFPMQKTFCAAENTACCLPFANTLAFQPSFSRHGKPYKHGSAHLAYRKRFVRPSDELSNEPP